MSDLAIAIVVLGAYLLGSLSFAVVVSRLMGLADPRSYGSKNPGATNVLRSGNKAAAVLTLLGDCLKGGLAVWLGIHFGLPRGLGEAGLAMVAVAVFLGHLYPVFFRFQGGKGVATAAGVLLALNPWLGLAVGLVWAIVAAVSRYSSLASLCAAAFAPALYAFMWGTDRIFMAILIIAILIAYRHRANISKLLAGRESRIGGKAADTKSA